MAKYQLDFKYTDWERITFDSKEEFEEAKKLIIEKGYSPSELQDELGELEIEPLYTCEYITPQENGGCSTIEIYEEDKLVYENGKV